MVEIVKGGVFLFCFFRQVFIKRVGDQGIFMDSLFHGVADTGGSFFMVPVQATAFGNGPDSGMMSFSALPASAAIARSREKFQSACRHISLHSSRICLHEENKSSA